MFFSLVPAGTIIIAKIGHHDIRVARGWVPAEAVPEADESTQPALMRPTEDVCEVTGWRHRVSPCRSASYASPW